MSIHIASLVVTLHLAEGSSLKEKRQVVKSLIETTRRKFNVSIAELGDLDSWRSAVIGIACVSNDAAHANRVIDKVLDLFESHPEFEVGAVEMEML